MRLIDAGRDVLVIRHLLTEAEAEARRGGELQPGPEHLVLAATTLQDGTALRALRRAGTDPEALRAALGQAHRGALEAAGVDVGDRAAAPLRAPATGLHRATATGQEVFHGAVALSKARTPARLRAADVVAAACRLERGTFVRALDLLGVDRDALGRTAEEEARVA